jgi:hypothetical protein
LGLVVCWCYSCCWQYDCHLNVTVREFAFA